MLPKQSTNVSLKLILTMARQETGAQGRIRTSVARKERQIYSLLPLTTRPPVQSPKAEPASVTTKRELGLQGKASRKTKLRSGILPYGRSPFLWRVSLWKNDELD